MPNIGTLHPQIVHFVIALGLVGVLFRLVSLVWRNSRIVAAAYSVVVTSDLGGELVYQYAGGVGTRSGEPDDITNLLMAGLYHGALVARDSGKTEVAARLIDELLRTRPEDSTVRLLAPESRLRDKKDPGAALADLDGFPIPEGNRLETRHGLLRAEALVAMGRGDSARVVLQALEKRYPQSRPIKDALAKLP